MIVLLLQCMIKTNDNEKEVVHGEHKHSQATMLYFLTLMLLIFV